MDAFRAMGGDEEFYIEYFQKPGRAEAELETDVRNWLLGMYYTASGEGVVTLWRARRRPRSRRVVACRIASAIRTGCRRG